VCFVLSLNKDLIYESQILPNLQQNFEGAPLPLPHQPILIPPPNPLFAPPPPPHPAVFPLPQHIPVPPVCCSFFFSQILNKDLIY
jgi:hypothetical protein